VSALRRVKRHPPPPRPPIRFPASLRRRHAATCPADGFVEAGFNPFEHNGGKGIPEITGYTPSEPKVMPKTGTAPEAKPEEKAEVKAELDYCCTSTNAVAVVNALKDREEIIFVPDKYLADYVSKQTKKKLISWNGFCPTHLLFQPEDVTVLKLQHPSAAVMVHPECSSEMRQLADFVGSTSKCAVTPRSPTLKIYRWH
jgi:hypothetical protein